MDRVTSLLNGIETMGNAVVSIPFSKEVRSGGDVDHDVIVNVDRAPLHGQAPKGLAWEPVQ